MQQDHYIAGKWVEGKSTAFESVNPGTGESLWHGNSASL